ncbi:hypothetical protein [Bogoriella caseilytica]|uniref:hypothetical protein n=1 Tax=Bogoriella caseilytica TaxID=56055 RepID=UPI0011CD824D|nr:hypothetical protein [Bogoriella caseilytica]
MTAVVMVLALPTAVQAVTVGYNYQMGSLSSATLNRIPASSSGDWTMPARTSSGRVQSDVYGCPHSEATYEMQLRRHRAFLPDAIEYHLFGREYCLDAAVTNSASWAAGQYHFGVMPLQTPAFTGLGYSQVEW